MRKFLLPIALLFLSPAATAQVKQPPAAAPGAPDAIIGSAKAPLPPREAEYIGVVEDARKQYLTARSVDGRKSARIAMQSAVHNFMGLSHSAEDWVGVFKNTKRNPTGTQSVEIEISPGVIVATWDNPASDATYYTLFQQTSPMGKLVSGLSIGDEVVFSANLIGAVISSRRGHGAAAAGGRPSSASWRRSRRRPNRPADRATDSGPLLTLGLGLRHGLFVVEEFAGDIVAEMAEDGLRTDPGTHAARRSGWPRSCGR